MLTYHSLVMYQSLRSRGSDTLLRVFLFLQTPIFCALFFPSSCPYPLASIPLSFLWAFSLLFTSSLHCRFPHSFSPFFSFTDFYCVCVYTCVFQHRQHLHRHADRLKKRPNKSLFPANRAIFRKRG